MLLFNRLRRRCVSFREYISHFFALIWRKQRQQARWQQRRRRPVFQPIAAEVLENRTLLSGNPIDFSIVGDPSVTEADGDADQNQVDFTISYAGSLAAGDTASVDVSHLTGDTTAADYTTDVVTAISSAAGSTNGVTFDGTTLTFHGETTGNLTSSAFAGTAAQNTTGDGSWTDISNATGSDNSTVASATMNYRDESSYLALTNFGLTIPTDAVITGIEVSISTSGDVPRDADITLTKNGLVTTTGTRADVDLQWSSGTVVAGGSSDLWGDSWTAADVNSADFGVLVQLESDDDGNTSSVGSVEVTIHFQGTVVAPGQLDFTVEIADDSIAETVETFSVQLSEPPGLTQADVSIVTATASTTITDNDPPTTVSIAGGTSVSEHPTDAAARTANYSISYDGTLQENETISVDVSHDLLQTQDADYVQAVMTAISNAAAGVDGITYTAGGDDKLGTLTFGQPSQQTSGIQTESAYAGTAAVSGTADGYWQNITNATGNTAVASTVGLDKNDQSDYLGLTGFGLNIPDDAIISGIEVVLSTSGTAPRTAPIVLTKDGLATVGGTSQSASAAWQGGTVTLGGSTDLWGESWTAAELNSADFGIIAQVEASGDGASFSLSSAQVTVSYEVPVPTPTQLDFSVEIVDDQLQEGDEAFEIELTGATSSLGAWVNVIQPVAATTIQDNDANSPAQGVPVITGTTTENETLSVDTSGISDADGLGAFSYQWLRDGVVIAGATSSTYMLQAADVGAGISVQVSFTDGQGFAETVSSTATAVVAAANTPPVGLPVIIGTAVEDQTLNADTSGISDADGLSAFSYQWLRNGADISGETADSYMLVDADVGALISVQVSYTDGGGFVETLLSAATAAVAGINDVPVGVPIVTGTVTEDETLTAVTTGITDDDGLGSFDHQWFRDGVLITGATGSTYTLSDPDVGSSMTVQVSYVDAQGTTEVLTSAATAPVADANEVPAGLPVILGTATEDQLLTADVSAISDADGLGAFSYQWIRDGVATNGETSTSYILTDADVGSVIRVEVSYTDGNGFAESLTSDPTAVVAGVNDTPTGVPVISGATVEDQVLSVEVSSIVDADGLGPFSYQWLRDGADITDAASVTYTLTDADVGTQISVQVSWLDAQGTSESLVSTATAVITGVNDSPVGLPVITGTVTEYETLTADTSGISDEDGLGDFSYQWFRGGVLITGATNSTFTLSGPDVGTAIGVQVRYTDGQGTVEVLTSTATDPVVDANEVPTGLPVVQGTPVEDQTLTVDVSGISDADGLGVFSYQWLRDGGVISGETGMSYTLTDADVGAAVSVQVSYTDGNSFAELLTSAPATMVSGINDSPIGLPTIAGTATQYEILTADITGISDDDGLGPARFQWLRDGTIIVGATGEAYALTADDVGAAVSVQVHYIDGQGTLEGPIISTSTGPVQAGTLPSDVITFSIVGDPSVTESDGDSDQNQVDFTISYSGSLAAGNTASVDVSHLTGDTTAADYATDVVTAISSAAGSTNGVTFDGTTLTFQGETTGNQTSSAFAGVAAQNTTGDGSWTDLSNATGSDINSFASVTMNYRDESSYLALTDFGLTIPADAVISGIEVSMATSGDVPRDADIKLTKDGLTTTTGPGADVDSQWGSGIVVAGGSTDLWGDSWTAAEVNSSDFGVLVQLESDDDGNTSSVGSVEVTIHYHGTVAGPNQLDFTVEIEDDSIAETGESFSVQLLPSEPGVYLASSIAASTITDNDPPTTVSIAGGTSVSEHPADAAVRTANYSISYDGTLQENETISVDVSHDLLQTQDADYVQAVMTAISNAAAGVDGITYTAGGDDKHGTVTFGQPTGEEQAVSGYAGTAAVSGMADGYWQDITNATGNTAAAATVGLEQFDQSNYLGLTGFGLNIPDNATVSGIEVTLTTSGSNPQSAPIVLTKDGLATVGGTSRSAVASWQGGTVTLGGSTDLWGQTWTAAELNSADFGVIARVEGNSDGSSFSLSSAQVTVSYEVPVVAPTQLDFSVEIADDLLLEGSETYQIELTDARSSLDAVVNLLQPTVTTTIVDNDVNYPTRGELFLVGDAIEGQQLSVDASQIHDLNGLGPFSWRWLRNGIPVPAATEAIYLLDDADVGSMIRAELHFTDGRGHEEIVSSGETAVVSGINDVPLGSPVIDGDAHEYETLTVDVSGIEDDDGVGTFHFQWQLNGTDISGATDSTYILTASDIGQLVSVVVQYTDGQGTEETLVSATVGPVQDANEPASGVPAILGSPVEDQLLTADVTGISDPNGVGNLNYQWLRNGVAIDGAVSDTFLLSDADVGHAIALRVSYSDGSGFEEVLTSVITASVENINDVPVGLPLISGTVREDETLSADTSAIVDDDGPGTADYQWLRDGIEIAGAVDTVLTLGDEDVGSRISVRVTYVDGFGTTESLTSELTAPVEDANEVPSGRLIITGNPVEDETLEADASGISDPDGIGEFSWQWFRDGQAIVGATDSTYTLSDADVATRLQVRGSYTDDHGFFEQFTSDETAVVTGVNDTPVGLPVITGTPADNQLLTADVSAIEDADGLGVLSYRWLRDGIVIPSATGTTYRLTDDDVGAAIRVQVTYTDLQATPEGPLVSAPTPVVTDVNDLPSGQLVISGTVTEDQILSVDADGIADEDGIHSPFSWQWLRNGTPIASANSETYQLTDADVGTAISVQATYTDGLQNTESVISTATLPVVSVNDIPTGLPVISGVPSRDQELSVLTTEVEDADGLGPMSYQWLRDGTAISGAVQSTYTLADADVGSAISVQVSWQDLQGTSETLTSEPTQSVYVNILPTVDLDTTDAGADYSTVYVPGLAAVAVTGPVAITDPDQNQIESALITLTNRFDGDLLTVGDSVAASGTTGSGINWAITDNVAGGVITIEMHGSATPFDYQTVIESIRFQNTAPEIDSASRQITVSVNDIWGSSATVSSTIAVTLNVQLSGTTLDENAPSGTTVGVFSVTPVTSGASPVFSLIPGEGSTDNHRFQLASDGTLQSATVPNFEQQGDYEIRVRIALADYVPVEQVIQIQVADVNESPGTITLSAQTVTENAPAGTVVGTAQAIDPDAEDSVTYSLTTNETWPDNELFSIDPDGTLRTAADISFEQHPTLTIQLRATDSGGLSTDEVFVITVQNENEAPSGLIVSGAAVVEHAPVGTVVATFGTTDPDRNETFTYTLVTGEGDTDNSHFTVDAEGILRTALVLDATAQATHSIRIRTTDPGGRFYEAAVPIQVINQNEAPAIAAPVTASIAEDSVLQLSGATRILIEDSDSSGPGQPVSVTIWAGNGTLTADGPTENLAAMTGNGQSVIYLSGALADVNAALASVSYTPAVNFTGDDRLVITVVDTPGDITEGRKTQSSHIDVAVTPVVDAAVNHLPSSRTTLQDVPLLLFSNTAISISDAEGHHTSVSVTLATAQGTLRVEGLTSGLASLSGDDSASVTLTGTISVVNSALQQLLFTPTAGFFGAAQLEMTTTKPDGTGSTLSTVDVLDITILERSESTDPLPETHGDPAVTAETAVHEYILNEHNRVELYQQQVEAASLALEAAEDTAEQSQIDAWSSAVQTLQSSITLADSTYVDERSAALTALYADLANQGILVPYTVHDRYVWPTLPDEPEELEETAREAPPRPTISGTDFDVESDAQYLAEIEQLEAEKHAAVGTARSIRNEAYSAANNTFHAAMDRLQSEKTDRYAAANSTANAALAQIRSDYDAAEILLTTAIADYQSVVQNFDARSQAASDARAAVRAEVDIQILALQAEMRTYWEDARQEYSERRWNAQLRKWETVYLQMPVEVGEQALRLIAEGQREPAHQLADADHDQLATRALLDNLRLLAHESHLSTTALLNWTREATADSGEFAVNRDHADALSLIDRWYELEVARVVHEKQAAVIEADYVYDLAEANADRNFAASTAAARQASMVRWGNLTNTRWSSYNISLDAVKTAAEFVLIDAERDIQHAQAQAQRDRKRSDASAAETLAQARAQNAFETATAIQSNRHTAQLAWLSAHENALNGDLQARAVLISSVADAALVMAEAVNIEERAYKHAVIDGRTDGFLTTAPGDAFYNKFKVDSWSAVNIRVPKVGRGQLWNRWPHPETITGERVLHMSIGGAIDTVNPALLTLVGPYTQYRNSLLDLDTAWIDAQKSAYATYSTAMRDHTLAAIQQTSDLQLTYSVTDAWWRAQKTVWNSEAAAAYQRAIIQSSTTYDNVLSAATRDHEYAVAEARRNRDVAIATIEANLQLDLAQDFLDDRTAADHAESTAWTRYWKGVAQYERDARLAAHSGDIAASTQKADARQTLDQQYADLFHTLEIATNNAEALRAETVLSAELQQMTQVHMARFTTVIGSGGAGDLNAQTADLILRSGGHHGTSELYQKRLVQASQRFATGTIANDRAYAARMNDINARRDLLDLAIGDTYQRSVWGTQRGPIIRRTQEAHRNTLAAIHTEANIQLAHAKILPEIGTGMQPWDSVNLQYHATVYEAARTYRTAIAVADYTREESLADAELSFALSAHSADQTFEASLSAADRTAEIAAAQVDRQMDVANASVTVTFEIDLAAEQAAQLAQSALADPTPQNQYWADLAAQKVLALQERATPDVAHLTTLAEAAGADRIRLADIRHTTRTATAEQWKQTHDRNAQADHQRAIAEAAAERDYTAEQARAAEAQANSTAEIHQTWIVAKRDADATLLNGEQQLLLQARLMNAPVLYSENAGFTQPYSAAALRILQNGIEALKPDRVDQVAAANVQYVNGLASTQIQFTTDVAGAEHSRTLALQAAEDAWQTAAASAARQHASAVATLDLQQTNSQLDSHQVRRTAEIHADGALLQSVQTALVSWAEQKALLEAEWAVDHHAATESPLTELDALFSNEAPAWAGALSADVVSLRISEAQAEYAYQYTTAQADATRALASLTETTRQKKAEAQAVAQHTVAMREAEFAFDATLRQAQSQLKQQESEIRRTAAVSNAELEASELRSLAAAIAQTDRARINVAVSQMSGQAKLDQTRRISANLAETRAELRQATTASQAELYRDSVASLAQLLVTYEQTHAGAITTRASAVAAAEQNFGIDIAASERDLAMSVAGFETTHSAILTAAENQLRLDDQSASNQFEVRKVLAEIDTLSTVWGDLLARIEITAVQLLHDNGASATDLTTTNPTITGTVGTTGHGIAAVIEVDHDGDGIPDGFTISDASGGFVYSPVGLANGQHTLRVRVQDDPGDVGWTDLTVTLESDPAVTESFTDLMLTAGETGLELSGSLSSTTESHSDHPVEVDWDADGTVDATVLSVSDGTFQLTRPGDVDAFHRVQVRVNSGEWFSLSVGEPDQLGLNQWFGFQSARLESELGWLQQQSSAADIHVAELNQLHSGLSTAVADAELTAATHIAQERYNYAISVAASVAEQTIDDAEALATYLRTASAAERDFRNDVASANTLSTLAERRDAISLAEARFVDREFTAMTVRGQAGIEALRTAVTELSQARSVLSANSVAALDTMRNSVATAESDFASASFSAEQSFLTRLWTDHTASLQSIQDSPWKVAETNLSHAMAERELRLLDAETAYQQSSMAAQHTQTAAQYLAAATHAAQLQQLETNTLEAWVTAEDQMRQHIETVRAGRVEGVGTEPKILPLNTIVDYHLPRATSPLLHRSHVPGDSFRFPSTVDSANPWTVGTSAAQPSNYGDLKYDYRYSWDPEPLTTPWTSGDSSQLPQAVGTGFAHRPEFLPTGLGASNNSFDRFGYQEASFSSPLVHVAETHSWLALNQEVVVRIGSAGSSIRGLQQDLATALADIENLQSQIASEAGASDPDETLLADLQNQLTTRQSDAVSYETALDGIPPATSGNGPTPAPVPTASGMAQQLLQLPGPFRSGGVSSAPIKTLSSAPLPGADQVSSVTTVEVNRVRSEAQTASDTSQLTTAVAQLRQRLDDVALEKREEYVGRLQVIDNLRNNLAAAGDSADRTVIQDQIDTQVNILVDIENELQISDGLGKQLQEQLDREVIDALRRRTNEAFRRLLSGKVPVGRLEDLVTRGEAERFVFPDSINGHSKVAIVVPLDHGSTTQFLVFERRTRGSYAGLTRAGWNPAFSPTLVWFVHVGTRPALEGTTPRKAAEVHVRDSDNSGIFATRAAALEFILHLIPGGASTDYLAQGDLTEFAISAVGDALLFARGFAAAKEVGKRIQSISRVRRSIAKTEMVADSAIAGFRLYQGISRSFSGEEGAAGAYAETVLRLIGVGLSSRELKSLSRMVDGATESPEAAKKVANQLDRKTPEVPHTQNRGTGASRDPARALLQNEDVLIDATHGLQSRMAGRFDDVVTGTHGDDATKYLWTIDERGINVALESTPFPTPRGNIVHTNLSRRASIGGEAWFESADTVIINAGSGRFGDGAGITRAQWAAAIRYWESLGYKVKAIPFGRR